MTMFNVAGVSINKGKVKVRFCSDMVLRIKNLQKQGDTDIQLINLPQPMSKTGVCKYLLTQPEFKKYHSDIQEILGKKSNAKVVVTPKIVVQKPEIDSELEEIKELVAA